MVRKRNNTSISEKKASTLEKKRDNHIPNEENDNIAAKSKVNKRKIKEQRKKKKKDLNVKENLIDEDLDSIDDNDNNNDPSFIPNQLSSEATEEKKKIKLTKKDKDSLSSFSPDFHMTFGEVKKKNEKFFEQKTKDEIAQLKSWYKYRHKLQIKKNQVFNENLLTSIQEPNEIMLKLVNEKIEQRERNLIAQVLETYLPAFLQKKYADEYLNEFLKEIDGASLQQVKEILLRTPLSLRMKANAKALSLFKEKNFGTIDDNVKISWFNNCIKPALRAQIKINYSEFDQSEIQDIVNICYFNGPGLMSDDEAIQFIKLLKHGDLLNLDQAYQLFND